MRMQVQRDSCFFQTWNLLGHIAIVSALSVSSRVMSLSLFFTTCAVASVLVDSTQKGTTTAHVWE
jgi:hypothetical protein